MASRGLLSQKSQTLGFTLIELMVTIAVLAILLMIAVPSFSRLVATNRMVMQTNEFMAGLNLARSEATKRSQFVSIRADVAGVQFASGWSVFTDGDKDGAPNSTVTDADGTIVRTSGALSGQTSIKRVSQSGTGPYTYADSTASDKRYIVFNARGAAESGSSSHFKVCDLGDSTIPGRIVQVNVVGKISVVSTTETCP